MYHVAVGWRRVRVYKCLELAGGDEKGGKRVLRVAVGTSMGVDVARNEF